MKFFDENNSSWRRLLKDELRYFAKLKKTLSRNGIPYDEPDMYTIKIPCAEENILYDMVLKLELGRIEIRCLYPFTFPQESYPEVAISICSSRDIVLDVRSGRLSYVFDYILDLPERCDYLLQTLDDINAIAVSVYERYSRMAEEFARPKEICFMLGKIKSNKQKRLHTHFILRRKNDE